MPGRSSRSKRLQYLGAVVALVAVSGSAVFGWRFGSSDSPIPILVGVVCAVVAIGWTLYRRRQ
jgi:1,4-dihydroxy-2-naphthoate octaprenyltransferase